MGPALRSKPPLITPSASPQPPRFSSRIPDHGSPSKRQRRDFQEFASSSKSRTQTPVPDVQKEREASTLRLLDVWASLAERYSRHMDDDDLVDIRTGEIIRDNGVLRNAPTLQFGTLAAPVDEVNEVEDEEEEDEYDFDELDAFAETAIDSDEEPKSELDTGGLTVPPATLDQAYADDLREFLEAEKIRKEQCGTDVDEDSQRDQQSDSEDSANDVVELELVHTVERRLVRSGGKMRELPPQDNDKEGGLKLIQGQGTCSEPIVVTSDDELDFWKADNSIPLVAHKPRQLHTPPPSLSSSKPSVSPLTMEHNDAPGYSNIFSDSDLSGDDSSPSGRHRRRPLLKHRNLHVKPASLQSPNSMAPSSVKIFRRDSPDTIAGRGHDSEITSSTKCSMDTTKKRAVVLLTPRKALKQLPKHAEDVSPEVPSTRKLSSRKGKAKERDDLAATTPDKHSTGRNVKIPLHTRLYDTDTELGETASSKSSKKISNGAKVVEASPKRPATCPHSHSLKRKWDSYSAVDVSEVTMESPKRQIASRSLSTIPFLQNRSTSATKRHTEESDSDSDYDQPVSEQQVHQKRSASYIDTQVPPPHVPYTHTTPNHQNHVANMFTPIPDPRAQLIIAQAVQQLSALVTGVWQPPPPHYPEGSSPHTPQRRSMSIQPWGNLHTPPHPHTYPSLYDPAFSSASFPPESPEPEHYSTASRRSVVSRSQSRVRRVTFQLSGEESDIQEPSSDTHQTPTTNRRSMNADALSNANSERGDRGSLRRSRGQTPGPSSNFHREIYK